MVFNYGKQHSLLSNWIAEIRDVTIQKDKLRFRKNIERIGEVISYEISKSLEFKNKNTTTPLGIHHSKVIQQQPVIASILRAGIPLHNGLLNYFDNAENAFIAAYRKHKQNGDFEINLEYVSCPNLQNKTLIIADPMLATGASIIKTIEHLQKYGTPAKIIIVVVIASTFGIQQIIQNCGENIDIYCGDVDEILSDTGYIIPGLGDAGDLAFGEKLQS
ncbi:MAG: uracil phosphoribosyltransferase [Sediminibacterium sp.]|nr:uracil phosphoribosyltransferase [Sediminibacterium sp.]